ncbi:MAG: hypothetical protein PVJ49_05570 [Acidobacteriota bacterium]|jgi:hypothetical protein
METQALVMGTATVGVWTANIILLVHHWRRHLFNDLPDLQRPYVMVVSGGILLTLHVTFMVMFFLSEFGVLPEGLTAAMFQTKVLWVLMILSLGFGIWTIVLARELEFAPRMKSRFQLEQREAARDGEIEALNRIEDALSEPLTELLFAVRGAMHDNDLSAEQKRKLEDAYRAGRQVVSALDRVAVEIENGKS